MFYAIVTPLLAEDGERIPPDRRAPPMRGMVVFGEMNRMHESEPYAPVADLWEAYGTARMRSMLHMSTPTILPNGKAPGMLISGIQRECWHDEGKLRIKEHRQVWQVVPTQRDGSE